MTALRLALLASLLVAATALPAQAGEPCEPCTLPEGTYHALAPAGWDGTTKLRLLLFLHGWRGTGRDITGDPNIAGVAGPLGFLLVAPDGGGPPGATSWGHVGSPHRDRDDVRFLLSVVADAERRWPIDRSAVVAGGFSQGGSMVWDLACYAAAQFTAFIPFSGGFWEPLPDACASGPVTLRHTHGLHDSMVPMTGRTLMAGQFQQGNIVDGFARWRAEDRCAPAPDRISHDGALLCSEWRGCAAGGAVELCLHDGDHSMIRPWLEASLRWAIGARPDVAR